VLRLVLALLASGASVACGFAALGLALYARSPAAEAAAGFFAAIGFCAGLVCGGLHAVFDGLPAPATTSLPPEALAGLVRATLGSAAAESASARPGTAADRQASPADLAAAALAASARSAAACTHPGAAPAPAAASRRHADSAFGA
jgi:hypothetical protein